MTIPKGFVLHQPEEGPVELRCRARSCPMVLVLRQEEDLEAVAQAAWEHRLQCRGVVQRKKILYTRAFWKAVYREQYRRPRSAQDAPAQPGG